MSQLRRQDVIELAVGACVMAFPVALTEEMWDLGETLSTGRALYFLAASVFFIGCFNYAVMFRTNEQFDRRHFFNRVSAVYIVTFVVCSLMLLGIDKFPLFEDPQVAIRRTILTAFPASFAATVIDSLRWGNN